MNCLGNPPNSTRKEHRMLDILFFSCYPFYMKLFHWRMRQLWQEERKT